jgi:hypothetical protein
MRGLNGFLEPAFAAPASEESASAPFSADALSVAGSPPVAEDSGDGVVAGDLWGARHRCLLTMYLETYLCRAACTTRCTLPYPTPSVRAISAMLTPWCARARISVALAATMAGRPIALPERVP